MKLQQYSWLINTLSQSSQGFTLQEINNLWAQSSLYDGRSIARTSFFRARDAILSQFGIIIECVLGKSDSRYRIGNPSELRQDSMKNWLYSTMAVSNIIADYTSLKDQILLENTPVDTTHLQTLLQAIHSQRCILLTYKKYTAGEPTARLLSPMALKLWSQRWYLLARQDGVYKVFSLNRVTEISLSDEKFTIPRSFSASQYFSECYGVLAPDSVPVERIVLRAYGQTPYYLRDLPLHHTQRQLHATSEYTDFELRLRPTPDFRNQLLTHGPNLQVLQPQHLAQEMRATIQRMAARYEIQ